MAMGLYILAFFGGIALLFVLVVGIYRVAKQKAREELEKEWKERQAHLPPQVAPIVADARSVATKDNPIAQMPPEAMVPMADELGEEQRFVYQQMENTHETMFVTGKAGTGKSHLLRYFVKNTKKDFAVVAPTGIAAVNVGGQTIHSFFHIDPRMQNPDNIDPVSQWRGNLQKKLRGVKVIIIDEVSMVRVDLMDMIDRKLQMASGNTQPFGGKQVIMFGDPYQLPPVVENDELLLAYLRHSYANEFFFSAPVFGERPIPVHELTNIYRQREPIFIDILNKIRDGSVTQTDIDMLNKYCYVSAVGVQHYPRLVPTKNRAKSINDEKLNSIAERPYTYHATISGKITQQDCPADKTLTLKVGALVVMLVNDTAGKRWVNGSIGTVSQLGRDRAYVKIGNTEYVVDRHDWEKTVYGYDPNTKKLVPTVIGTFTQYPMRLAWALTIHKSQGQTYQTVTVDMGDGAFAPGQTYVALSRCVSMDKLYLTRPIQPRDIWVNPIVSAFMRPDARDSGGNAEPMLIGDGPDRGY